MLLENLRQALWKNLTFYKNVTLTLAADWLLMSGWRMAPAPMSFDHVHCSLFLRAVSEWLWLSYQLSFLLHNPIPAQSAFLSPVTGKWLARWTGDTRDIVKTLRPSPGISCISSGSEIFSWRGQQSAPPLQLHGAGAVPWLANNGEDLISDGKMM